ncbi:hypothetical protein J7T55_001275 [Diaporthe amygdali]|uniref:uncharacterized protein n=1 Tax=Phomopsis amygdali TaxID=1214568 RepID=UPI0022FF0A7F|nr:uncharacterized protein J7T55_001275 [Diaporthe amygdali]KAJ0106751.1 hypothetical protein J7T55_001275 [Diaporthe amygdali]
MSELIMSCKEPDTVVIPERPDVADFDSTCEGGNPERQSGIDRVENHRTHSVSSSMETIDGANGNDAVKHGSARGSHDVSSESTSLQQDGNAAEDAMSSKSSPEDEDLFTWLKEQPKKVNVKWSDYEAFRNRFSFEEGLDVIEVLEGDPDQLRMEISRERGKRHMQHKKHSASRGKHQVENDAKFIHLIKIQSEVILYVLARLTGADDWNGVSSTFLRPFQTFYYSLPYAKQALKILERLFNEQESQSGGVTIYSGPLERLEGVHSIETEDPVQKLSMPSDLDIEDIIYGLLDFNSEAKNILTAVEHMKLYTDFVEKYIVPMWVEARGSSKHKVRFSDLPMFYRPGDILYEPLRAGDFKTKARKADFDAARSGGLAVHQNYWKLCYAHFEAFPSHKGRQDKEYEHIGTALLNQSFRLSSYHVDFDGDNYGPMPCETFISNYEGERDIRSLTLYPLRFYADAAQTFTDLTARAKNFLSYVLEKHLSYDGWPLIHETYAGNLGKKQKRDGAEHIEGEIMIDFKEGFQSDSGFVKPKFDIPAELESGGPTQHSSHINKEDKVLRAFGEEQVVSDFDPEHLFLFPQRLIAYSLRARRFFVANIDSISFITAPKSPFRDLKIEVEHKRILKSLVGRHFEKQDIRRQNKDAILDQDFIRGKGSGLIILLHGVPGVGKTTTAEAVALENRKPLFALTSGDLGSTSKDVETALRETFRLAALWNCVLLLDEADLFLAKRDIGDLVRNSLVSVFLRVLDYYDGVLFLTTNRVGIVDEAFRSRIHLSLYYPALRKKQALEIFKLNIRRIKEIEKSKAVIRGKGDDSQPRLPPTEIDEDSILNFATRHWENARNNPSRRWNGRQIRNSFQIAYSLVNLNQISVPESHYDDDYDDEEVDYDDEPGIDDTHSGFKDPGVTVASSISSGQEKKLGKLDSSQFEIVARSIQRFDSYLYRTQTIMWNQMMSIDPCKGVIDTLMLGFLDHHHIVRRIFGQMHLQVT